MRQTTRTICYGVLFLAGLAGVIGMFPVKVGEAFTCLIDHLAQLSFPFVKKGHLWPSGLWPWLCLWVVSLGLSLIGGLGLLGVWATAANGRRLAAMFSKRPIAGPSPEKASSASPELSPGEHRAGNGPPARCKKISAIIRTNKLADVEHRLQEISVKGMSTFYVFGYGEGQSPFDPEKLTRHVKIEIWACEQMVERIVQTILEAAHLGVAGDGMVTVLPVEQVWRIRTKQKATAHEV